VQTDLAANLPVGGGKFQFMQMVASDARMVLDY
jgi:hypothetical protein